MKVEVKHGVTFLYPEENKKLKRIDGINLFSAVALAKSDSQDNYEEVDELWTPESVETNKVQYDFGEEIVIQPDNQGKVNYEDIVKVLDVLDTMKRRIIDLENKLNS